MNELSPLSPPPNTSPSWRWKFFRAGNLDQVSLTSGRDLANLRQLDQKLWVALSCPAQGLECDAATLQLIDLDKDGLVRVPELLEAIEWACDRLLDPDTLVDGNEHLALDKIKTDTSTGAALASAARAILDNLGKAEATDISVAETSKRTEIFSKAAFNGDGVVPPEATDDVDVSQAIRDIVDCTGGTLDRGGSRGVDRALLGAFFDELERYANWSQTESPESTPVGFDSFQTIKTKIDDYFSRCRLVAFDSRAADPLNRNGAEFDSIGDRDLSSLPSSVRALPLAAPRPDLKLDLSGKVNPAWSQELADFRSVVLERLEPDAGDLLSLDTWNQIRRRFSEFENRHQKLDSFRVRKLSAERTQELLGSDARQRIEALIQQDEQLSDEVAAIDDLDRLVRYQRDLHLIARNFVNFRDFFSLDQAAIFQAGVLYIDSRACRLCVRVANPLAHSTLASLSRCYILYCECSRAGEAPAQIAAVLSNGGSDNLMIGRNGVFYDRQGRDWHARVVKIVENPISIREAFWSPYKRFAKFVDAQISKRVEASEKAVTERLASNAENIAQADKARGQKGKIEVGTVAAIGVAVGSIGTFVSMLLIRAISLGPWLPLALVAVVLLISVPSMFLAWLRLRQRTLGPILDANGWAVNGQIRINTRLATALTGIRKLPKGAKRSLKESRQHGSSGTGFVLAVVVAIALATALGVYLYQTERWSPFWIQPPSLQEIPLSPTPLDSPASGASSE